MRVFFSSEVDPLKTISLLQKCYDDSMLEISILENIPMKNIAFHSKKVSNKHSNEIYWNMTIKLGIACAKATAEWAKDAIKEIEKELI